MNNKRNEFEPADQYNVNLSNDMEPTLTPRSRIDAAQRLGLFLQQSDAHDPYQRRLKMSVFIFFGEHHHA